MVRLMLRWAALADVGPETAAAISITVGASNKAAIRNGCDASFIIEGAGVAHRSVCEVRQTLRLER